ncbi:hypothetical protein HS7_06790 [Sulfolobales archaeon HS-7]|nr:hypothetical protein HS7_06790 [Sulfolobales archaeon HS-7]
MSGKIEEEALFFLKPDSVIRRGVGANVLKEILSDNYELLHPHILNVPREFYIEYHYSMHKGKFFFNWLINYVTASPVLVAVIKGDDVVAKLRDKLGNTMCERASPTSIRGKFGIFGGINVAHLSDSREAAEREVRTWTKHFLSKEEGKINVDDYINKYINFPHLDTKKYRELSVRLVKNEIEIKDAENSFKTMLMQETDLPESYVTNLVEVILENAKLGR